MQAPPPLQITVDRFGVWRLALLSLTLCVMMALWLWCRYLAIGWAHWVACLAMAGLTTALAFQLGKVQPCSLRWDSERWFWGAAAERGHEPHTGQLRVVIDLGAWMLLQLRAEALPTSQAHCTSNQWLPVQRAGLQTSWHLLRCLVHASPRSSRARPATRHARAGRPS